MELRSLIGKLQSPSFQTVVAIANHAGPGMAVERLKSIRFPVGTVQVWEFVPKLPPLDRDPVVVAVLTRKHKIVSWAPSPLEAEDYDPAVAHFTRLAAATWEKAHALAADRRTPPASPAPASPAPTRTLVLPGPPPGLRITTATGCPLTLGGQPVTVTAAVPRKEEKEEKEEEST